VLKRVEARREGWGRVVSREFVVGGGESCGWIWRGEGRRCGVVSTALIGVVGRSCGFGEEGRTSTPIDSLDVSICPDMVEVLCVSTVICSAQETRQRESRSMFNLQASELV